MTCSHMSYFFISKQLLWELFFRISNSKATNLKYIDAGRIEDKNTNVDDVAKNIVDGLPNNEKCFYFVSYFHGGIKKMLVQKYLSNDYAAYILFGYGIGTISYHVKTNGIWR